MPKSTKAKTAKPVRALPAGDDSAAGRIIRAAMAAFMERGYAGASTLEIATRAKVSKRELYTHFGTKEAMVVACIGRGVEVMRMPLALPPARDRAGLVALLTAFGANFLRVFLSKQVIALYRLAVAEAERSPEVAQTLDSAGRGGARAALAELLTAAQAAGLIGRGEDLATMVGRFFALLLADWHMRLLLGVAPAPSPQAMQARAEATAQALLALYPES